MNFTTLHLELFDRAGFALLHFLWQGVVIAAGYAAIQYTFVCPRVRSAAAAVALALMIALPVVTVMRQGSDQSSLARLHSISAPSGSVPNHTLLEKGFFVDDSFISVSVKNVSTWRIWIGIGWFMGAALFALRLTGAWFNLHYLRKRSIPVEEGNILAAFDNVIGRIGIRRKVILLKHSRVISPITFGWLKPVILLPVSALAGLSHQQIELILAHELAHIRRQDYLINLMQTIAETVLFFHPAVWWVSRRLRREREFACDDMVLKRSESRFDYAKALTSLESSRLEEVSQLAQAANNDDLLCRIERILKTSNSRKALPSSLGIFIALVITVALFSGTLLAQKDAEKLTTEQKAKEEAPKKKDWTAYHTKGKEGELAKEILAMPDGDLKLLALSGLVRRWIESDTEAAWEFGENLKDRKTRVTFFRAAGKYLANEDPGRILDALEAGQWWPDQWISVRDATLKMADYDLDRAIKSYVKFTPERMQLENMSQRLAELLVKRDTVDAGLAFAKRLERPIAYNGAIQGVLSVWVTIDEGAAVTYAEDIKDKKLQSFAILGLLVGKNWFANPDDTLEWVMALGNDDLRRNTLVYLVWLWNQRKDTEQVENIVRDQPIPIDDLRYLEHRLKQLDIFVPEK
ncbi:MAG: M56 family metallopeptidase [Verrucomicrobiota bacterium]